VNVVALLVPDFDWLAAFTIFGYFDTKELIGEGVLALGNVGVFIGIAAACWVAAVILFGRRDLAA
jgi:ABC-type transport system involved in multi-copper enzyme maturation permease subunit